MSARLWWPVGTSSNWVRHRGLVDRFGANRCALPAPTRSRFATAALFPSNSAYFPMLAAMRYLSKRIDAPATDSRGGVIPALVRSTGSASSWTKRVNALMRIWRRKPWPANASGQVLGRLRHTAFIAFILFLITSLFCARLAGVHLHISVDGDEAPVSVQTELRVDDLIPHVSPQHKEPKADIDLYFSDVVAKVKTSDYQFAVVACLLLLVFFVRVSSVVPTGREKWRLPTQPPHVFPPLRGPPLPLL